jgi:hexokinase
MKEKGRLRIKTSQLISCAYLGKLAHKLLMDIFNKVYL